METNGNKKKHTGRKTASKKSAPARKSTSKAKKNLYHKTMVLDDMIDWVLDEELQRYEVWIGVYPPDTFRTGRVYKKMEKAEMYISEDDGKIHFHWYLEDGPNKDYELFDVPDDMLADFIDALHFGHGYIHGSEDTTLDVTDSRRESEKEYSEVLEDLRQSRKEADEWANSEEGKRTIEERRRNAEETIAKLEAEKKTGESEPPVYDIHLKMTEEDYCFLAQCLHFAREGSFHDREHLRQIVFAACPFDD